MFFITYKRANYLVNAAIYKLNFVSHVKEKQAKFYDPIASVLVEQHLG